MKGWNMKHLPQPQGGAEMKSPDNRVNGSGAESKAEGNRQVEHIDNSAAAQRVRLLTWLQKHRKITTIEARRDLDIMMPAARIKELKDRNYRIDKLWAVQPTERGRLHRIAEYWLLAESEGAA